MYKPTKKTLSELREHKKELTQKIINSQDLDYPAMEKLKRQMAQINKELKEMEEEVNRG